MNRSVFWIALCIATAPLTAQGQAPKWYSDLDSAYPAAKYMAAVGTGDTRRDAESDAAAGLSRQFSVDIHAEQLSEKRFIDLTKGDKTYSASSDSLSSSVQATSNQAFVNLAFSDPYVDKKGLVSIVAYLDRQKTADLYRTMINRDLTKAGQFSDRANGADDTLRSFALLDAAKQIGLHAELLLGQLRIIQPGMAKLLEDDVNFDAVDRARDALSKKLTFKLAIDGDSDGKIGSIVQKTLADQSLSASADGTMTIKGTWLVEPVTVTTQYKSVHWVINLSLLNEKGVAVATVYKESRENAVTNEAAVALAYREVGKRITNDLAASFTDYLTSVAVGK